MNDLSNVETIRIQRRHVTQAMIHLRDVGTRGLEGLALWAGVQSGAAFEVTDTIIPHQQGHRTKSGVCVTIGPQELHRLNVWLYQNKRTLVGQIHSHPTHAYHSDTDDDFPIATAVGSISLVVPDFARRPLSLETAAAYRLSRAAKWEKVPLPALAKLLQLTD